LNNVDVNQKNMLTLKNNAVKLLLTDKQLLKTFSFEQQIMFRAAVIG